MYLHESVERIVRNTYFQSSLPSLRNLRVEGIGVMSTRLLESQRSSSNFACNKLVSEAIGNGHEKISMSNEWYIKAVDLLMTISAVNMHQ
jgi:hypothetical protein